MMEKKSYGIVRNRMTDYFKAKGKKIVSKKR